ncbi:TetR/AcrR family transcriptional regulator [Curtobacterium poinsettiae]|uniref:TetR/AcrR family transcriptional regulator n=1 Tax=Curtobacterium poinsettiae TaxID=159612 RepID=UPI0023610EA0|nr:TetR/AcrR family transcriptional regulator [Curtobacterium flaccumfaciens]MDD1386798.1 helix-turn-helix domain containing protein [Curtobacterium flaccumfaciens pv. poinsettiae]
MPARNHEFLTASMRAFAARGYFGTTTAQVAEQMGVSQPYVIQAYGSKRDLFIRTHAQAGEMVVDTFRSASTGRFEPQRLGAAYRDLVLSEPAAVLVYAHGFSAARAEPEIGREARRLFGEVYRTLRDIGGSDQEVSAFIGRGMLINNLILMEAPRYADEHGFRELVEIVLGVPPTAAPRTSDDTTVPDQE